MGHIFDSECDARQDIWTLQTRPTPVDRVMYRFAEEVRLASWVWRVGRDASSVHWAKPRFHEVRSHATTVAGHLRTVA